jgi:hypothetical protein
VERDWRDNTVTAGSTATIAGVDSFVQGFLAYENNIVQIFNAVDAGAACAPANAYAAMAWLFLESPEGACGRARISFLPKRRSHTRANANG